MQNKTKAKNHTAKKPRQKILVWEKIKKKGGLLSKWLGSNSVNSNTVHVNYFLGKVDDFDLNDFVQKIDFGNISVPEIMPDFPKVKVYRTIDEMKQSDLDFILKTVFRIQGNSIYTGDMSTITVIFAAMAVSLSAAAIFFTRKKKYK